MRAAMKIKEHIQQAESIFIDGSSFDDERINFITNLNTCDLLAVPGSGKTTALIAKLYCIAQNMPFDDGSGVLVLAHTNNTVEEVEKKLKRHCPQLFDYPNYVGTIQSFVNKFLANQACYEKYESYIVQNEDEAIEQILAKKVFSNKSTKIFGLLSMLIKAKHNTLSAEYLLKQGILNTEEFLEKLQKLNIIDKDCVLQNIKNCYDDIIALPSEEKQIIFDFNKHIKSYTENINEFISLVKEISFDYSGECFRSNIFPKSWNKKLYFSKKSGSELKMFFEDLMRNGLLKYSDSFELANYFLNQHPHIKKILQHRFKFVFVDEMQDLEASQINIIDDIFYDENSTTVIQRVGDINQSIYSSGKKVKIECDWKPRKPEFLNNSHRLTEEVAKLVNCFTLDPQEDPNNQPRFKVEGLRKLDKPIQPHLIIFDLNISGDELQNKFEELIKRYKLDKTDSGKKNGFKIIAWNTVWENDEPQINKDENKKIRLKNLFCDYSKESKAKKEYFDCLKKYLQLYNQDKMTFVAVRDSILNALVQVLRLEGINKAPNTLYRKTSLMEFIRNQGDEIYDDFKAKLFQWCFTIVVNKEFDKVYSSIKQFIEKDFISWNWLNEENVTDRVVDKSKDFINSTNYKFQQLDTSSLKSKVRKNLYNIEIDSVHAVKGQTHCATMYVETAYKQPIYETLKIKELSRTKSKKKQDKKTDPFLFEPHSCEGPEAKNALKMMYVGFSRPTHLLCFAVLKENIGEAAIYESVGWIIDDITISKLDNPAHNNPKEII